jgi:hypothetical protein
LLLLKRRLPVAVRQVRRRPGCGVLVVAIVVRQLISKTLHRRTAGGRVDMRR